MVYTFHRSTGFYPIELTDDAAALWDANNNPGTLKVVNQETGRVVFEAKPEAKKQVTYNPMKLALKLIVAMILILVALAIFGCRTTERPKEINLPEHWYLRPPNGPDTPQQPGNPPNFGPATHE